MGNYIGREPLNGFFTKQVISHDGSTTTFALTHAVASTTSIIVSVNAVILQPDIGYTLSGGGNNIIFASAPSATAYVHYLGQSVTQSLLDLNGAELVLDVDSDTTITADTDDQIDFKLGGSDVIAFKTTGIHLPDGEKYVGGTGDDLQLYHDGSNSYLANSTGELRLATLTSGIAIAIGHSTSEVTFGDNVTVTGNLTIGGTTNFGDFNITNVGSIALDTITNDGTDITLDSSGDIILDAAGNDIFLKAGGTTFGSITNVSTHVVIKDGTTTAATFNGANVTFAGTIGSGNITSTGTVQGTTITATTAFVPDASDGAALGTTALEFSDLFLADGAVISLGDDDDVTLTHVADTGVLLNAASVIQFRDSAINIGSPADGDLDINADDEIELNSTLIDINGNVEISGTLAQADAITMATNKKIIFRDAAIHISSTADGDLSIAADDEIDITSTLIDINGNVEISGTAVTTGVHTFSAAPVFPDGSIAVADLDIDGATDIGAAVVDADLFIIDDGAGGTNRKVTASRLKTYIGDNTPAFDVRLTSNQTIANNTFTKLAFATETLDSDGKFASNKFTPTVAGYYFITYSIYYDVVDDNEILSLKIYKNGSGDNATERNNFATGTNNDIMVWGTYLIYLDADDYVELFTKQGSGGDATAYTGNTTFSGFRVSGV